MIGLRIAQKTFRRLGKELCLIATALWKSHGIAMVTKIGLSWVWPVSIGGFES